MLVIPLLPVAASAGYTGRDGHEVQAATVLRTRIPSFRETPHQLDDDIIDQGSGSEAQPTDYGEPPER